MTISHSRNFWVLLLSAVMLPAVARPAAISVNGTCELGTCGTPGTLSSGMTISTTSFSFFYTAPDTDKFLINGTYAANGTSPSMNFFAQATYLGNSTHTTSGNDTLSVNLLEDFTSTSSLDGSYTEHATLTQHNVAAGSNVTGELSFGGQGIGLMGPYSGTGSQTFTGGPTALTGLGDSTNGDFNYTFNLKAGSTAIPEPAELGLLGLGFAGLVGLVIRRRKRPVTFVQ